jgi:hypothetical protein
MCDQKLPFRVKGLASAPATILTDDNPYQGLGSLEIPMGVFLSFDELHQVLYVRFEGVITDDVFLSRYQQVREWVASNGPFSSISDFGGVTSFEVTSHGIDQLALHSPLVPDSFLRIVLAPQDEIFGMARMFGMIGSVTRNKVYVVRTSAEAYRLLGVESLDLRPVAEW